MDFGSHARAALELLDREPLDRGRERFGPMRFAIGQNLLRIFLQTVVIQNVAAPGCVVVAAHEKSDKILALGIISEPIPAGDFVHIEIDLS